MSGTMTKQIAQPVVKQLFVELPKMKVLSRPPDARSEITVYVKGFLAEGDTPDNFADWMHSHRLLVLSKNWEPTALGFSWPSGTASVPLPFATLASASYLLASNLKRLSQLRLPTPATILGAFAVDIGLHTGRLAYQFNQATNESKERAEILALRLLRLRSEHEHVRIVAHSLGCRHVVEALSKLKPDERPDSVHLCAPALVAEDVMPYIGKGQGGLARNKTIIYYSPKDMTLGVLLRAILGGARPLGEAGLDPKTPIDSTVQLVDASSSLGFFSHTDYADKFHFMAR
ncbi:hypothetical protein INT43_001083 [Umbelopsis isabellina]|uniref:Alpha/beta hydrolase n=1 Tax=Mortierella isabellina TaxID=91625 RepID=A0A8H7PK70_MORIS|nr:hypothetical protein INT43_001083 [Umbelopsis isabellina]